jgi:hypothetical protein
MVSARVILMSSVAVSLVWLVSSLCVLLLLMCLWLFVLVSEVDSAGGSRVGIDAGD